MPRLWSGVFVAVLAVLFAALESQEVQGQVFRIVPQVGLHMPVNDFGELSAEGADGAVEFGRKSSTLALGVAGEVDAGDLPFGVRATVTYGTSAPVSYVTEECPECRTRGDLWVATATGVFRPLPRLLVARPYVLAGGGFRWFGFDQSELAGDGFEGILRDQARAVAHLGGGLDVTRGNLAGIFEVTGVVGRFEPGGGRRNGETVPAGSRRTLTDIFVTVGLSFDL